MLLFRIFKTVALDWEYDSRSSVLGELHLKSVCGECWMSDMRNGGMSDLGTCSRGTVPVVTCSIFNVWEDTETIRFDDGRRQSSFEWNNCLTIANGAT